jgi:hypothetical protein
MRRTRKPGGGRPPKLTSAQDAQGIRFVRENQDKYPGTELYRALRTELKLKDNEVSDGTLYKRIISKAIDDQPRPLQALDLWREINRDIGAPSSTLLRLQAEMEGARKFFERPEMRELRERLNRADEVAQRLMGRRRPISPDGDNV